MKKTTDDEIMAEAAITSECWIAKCPYGDGIIIKEHFPPEIKCEGNIPKIVH